MGVEQRCAEDPKRCDSPRTGPFQDAQQREVRGEDEQHHEGIHACLGRKAERERRSPEHDETRRCHPPATKALARCPHEGNRRDLADRREGSDCSIARAEGINPPVQQHVVQGRRAVVTQRIVELFEWKSRDVDAQRFVEPEIRTDRESQHQTCDEDRAQRQHDQHRKVGLSRILFEPLGRVVRRREHAEGAIVRLGIIHHSDTVSPELLKPVLLLAARRATSSGGQTATARHVRGAVTAWHDPDIPGTPFLGLRPATTSAPVQWAVERMAGQQGVALVVPSGFGAYARLTLTRVNIRAAPVDAVTIARRSYRVRSRSSTRARSNHGGARGTCCSSTGR